MLPSDVWGAAYADEDDTREVGVCIGCQDELKPQRWAPSILNPEGGMIPL